MIPLEHRLRQRVDHLTDERDAAREQLAVARRKLAAKTKLVYDLRQSRDRWRDQYQRAGKRIADLETTIGKREGALALARRRQIGRAKSEEVA